MEWPASFYALRRGGGCDPKPGSPFPFPEHEPPPHPEVELRADVAALRALLG